MRFQLKGKRLKKKDKKLLYKFCHYTAKTIKIRNRSALVRIYFVNEDDLRSEREKEDLREFLAWINHFGYCHFTIIVHEGVLLHQAKNDIVRLKHAMMCIGHELVHVKQYVNGEMRDYIRNGDVWYKGQRYEKWQEDEDYYFSPWEVEAYGHEEGLYKCFKKRFQPK